MKKNYEQKKNLFTLKTKHNENFKTIDLTCVQDKSLSWKAKGIHNYLNTRPDNWQIFINSLKKMSEDGSTSLRSGIKELIMAGYVFRIVKRNKQQQIIQWGYYTSETPVSPKKVKEIIGEEWLIVQRGGRLHGGGGNATCSETLIVGNQPHSKKNGSSNKDGSNNIGEEELRSSSMTDSLRSSVGKIKRAERISIKDLSDGIEEEQKTYLIHKNRKKMKKVIMSDNVCDIIEHWNNSLGLRKLKYNTRLHQRTVVSLNKLMKGTFFSEDVFGKDEDLQKHIGRKFSPEKIINSISNFALVIDDAHYSPKESTRRWYKKHSLNSFIFDRREFTSKKGVSLFIQMLTNKLKPSHVPSIPIKDNYPIQTLALKNSYVKNVLGGVNGNMSEKDINSFKIGSEKLNNFYKANSRKIFNVVGGINDMPKLLFRAIEKECENRNSPVRPFKFSSDYAFTHTLPAYLRDQGIIYSDAEIQDGDIKVQTGDDY